MARKWLLIGAMLLLSLQAVVADEECCDEMKKATEPAASTAAVAAEPAAAEAAKPAAAATSEDPEEYSVLTLHDSSDVKMDEFAGVFAQLGVPAQHAQMIAQTVSSKGSAPVMEGPRSSLEKICSLFADINVKCEVAAKPGGAPAAADAGGKRPAAKSPFDGSAVSMLDAAGFQKEVELPAHPARTPRVLLASPSARTHTHPEGHQHVPTVDSMPTHLVEK